MTLPFGFACKLTVSFPRNLILLHWLTESKYTKYSQALSEDLCLLSFSADSFPKNYIMLVIGVVCISVIPAVAVTVWKRRWDIYLDNVDSNKREMLSGLIFLFFPPTRLKKINQREIILWLPHLQPAWDVKWVNVCNLATNVSLLFFFNLFSKSRCTLTL